MQIKININELDVARVMTIGKALGGHFVMDHSGDLQLVQDEPLSKAIDNLTQRPTETFKQFEARKVMP